MTTTIIQCDKCGERIDADRTLLAVECGSQRDRRSEIDLCRDCAEAFAAWLAERETKRGEHGEV